MALTLRQALWRKADPAWPVCGLAATPHSDHGADFTSSHVRDVVVLTSYVQDRPVTMGMTGVAIVTARR
jgi:transposase InsO family protein